MKLDDTSTWLAFTDHVLTYGHSTAGIPPSSYEATVQINLSAGYPLGAFIPLGIGHELTGQDSAWLFQPYLALMAAMMSLVFFELVKPVVSDVRVRLGRRLHRRPAGPAGRLLAVGRDQGSRDRADRGRPRRHRHLADRPRWLAVDPLDDPVRDRLAVPPWSVSWGPAARRGSRPSPSVWSC